jgi:ATP-dependent Clp endopeptidase proteolytic subunit ClpP
MKWKYNLTGTNDNNEAEPDENHQQIFINTGGPGNAMSSNIRVVENTIFFYSDITDQTVLDLNTILYELDIKLNNTYKFLGPDFTPHIKLRINSYGGSVLAGMSTLDTIRSLKSEVHTYIDGAAASAATIISIAGKKRFIGKNSLMLIHQLSAGAYGKFSEMEDDMENNRRIMKMIKDIYKQYTKVPMKQIDEILKHDLWFDSAKCLEFGLVDQVL